MTDVRMVTLKEAIECLKNKAKAEILVREKLFHYLENNDIFKNFYDKYVVAIPNENAPQGCWKYIYENKGSKDKILAAYKKDKTNANDGLNLLKVRVNFIADESYVTPQLTITNDNDDCIVKCITCNENFEDCKWGIRKAFLYFVNDERIDDIPLEMIKGVPLIDCVVPDEIADELVRWW